MRMNNTYGIRAENYFSSQLNELGLENKYINDWYDFIVEGEKVEVKSCELSIKQTKKKGRKRIETYRSGRFHFTEKKNRKLQYNHNIWVCFILRHVNDFIILGFIRAKKLKMRKHLCVHTLKKLKLISLNQWVGKIIK